MVGNDRIVEGEAMPSVVVLLIPVAGIGSGVAHK